MERVDRSSVLPYPEIEVRTRGAPRGADISYDFTLTDSLADLKAGSELGKVEIGSGIYRIVLNSHCVASCAFVLAACHYAVSDGHHRGSCRSGIIDSGVGLDLARYRVLAGV